MGGGGGFVLLIIFFCLAEYEYMAVCRLSQEYIVGKILRVGQALDLRGYYQTMLVYLLRDWLKKALSPMA